MKRLGMLVIVGDVVDDRGEVFSRTFWSSTARDLAYMREENDGNELCFFFLVGVLCTFFSFH